MTTVQEFFRNKLEEDGLNPHQVDAVLPLIIQHDSMDLLRGRWTSDIGSYPAGMFHTSYDLARPIVAEWCVVHAPHAWFRPQFDLEVLNADDKDAAVKAFWEKNRPPLDDAELDKVLDEGLPENPCAQITLTMPKERKTGAAGSGDFTYRPEHVFDPLLEGGDTPVPDLQKGDKDNG